MAATGTPTPYETGADNGVDQCNTSTAGSVVNTGSRSTCLSNWGVHDMVGNQSEWVADWMQGNDAPWGPAGNATNNTIWGADYIWGLNPATVVFQGTGFPTALVRGGMWAAGFAAGEFAIEAKHSPGYHVNWIGFRCVR